MSDLEVKVPRPMTRAIPMMLLCTLMLPTEAKAAKQLVPTTEAVRDPLNVVAVVRVGERVADDRYRFIEVDRIHGDRPGPWVVRMTKDLARTVDPEREYVIAFTDWIPDPNLKTLPPKKDPDGFKLVSVSLVGECLIPAELPVRTLFLASGGFFDDQREEAMDTALATLRRSDPIVQRFGAGELGLRAELSDSYETHQQSVVAKFVNQTQNDTVARSTMLSAALIMPPQPKLDWLPIVARQVIGRINPAFTGDPHLPGLAVAALQALGKRGAREDCEIMAPFLRSNQVGVAGTALRAMADLHPKTAAREAQAALDDPDLPAQSRRNFESFVQQMTIRGIKELREQESRAGAEEGEN
jgi:hypothetical protein